MFVLCFYLCYLVEKRFIKRRSNDYEKMLLVLVTSFVAVISYGQVVEGYVDEPITYSQYLNLIIENNIEYAAEKLNVDISKANIRTAGAIPDPELTIEGTDNGERSKQMGYEFEASLDWTLELGGKRRARVELAKSESDLSVSILENYYRNLRADATLEFLSALRNENLYKTKLEAYGNMNKIAKTDSVRYLQGEISELTARQSKLEARTMLIDVMEAETEWINGLMFLDKFVNKNINDTILKPEGGFESLDRSFVLSDLIITAQNNRGDLMAALQNVDVAKKIVNLERANRKIDLGLSFKVGHNTYAHNEIAPTPAHTPVSVGVSIPLKFSNSKNSDLKVAQFQHQQAEYAYSQIEKEIAIEVAQAYRLYNTMCKQLGYFDNGIIVEARTELDGRISNYKRGENSLLEVLDAQRTYNDIREKYFETLYSTAAALVNLERAVGIWDISL